MTRRNVTTTFMVLGAGLLLFGGVALAREAQTRDDRNNPAVVTPTATAADDKGGQGAASPSASPDDHGGSGVNSPTATAKPTARATAKPAARATAKPTARATTKPAATATASPDDHGGHGGDDSPSSTDDHGGHGGD